MKFIVTNKYESLPNTTKLLDFDIWKEGNLVGVLRTFHDENGKYKVKVIKHERQND